MGSADLAWPLRAIGRWLVELYGVYHSQGVEFIGISIDDPGQQDAIKAFIGSAGVNYTILLGNTAAADAYGGVRLMPQTFLIARDGTLVDSTIGITSKADVDAAVRRLLATAH